MPKKPAVDKQILFSVLCSARSDIVQNGTIAIPSTLIWAELSEQLDKKMSAKAIYTFVKANRHGIWSALQFGNVQTDDSSVKSDCEDSDLTPNQDDEQTFIIDIPFEKWTLFIPEEVEYRSSLSMSKKRKYSILKPHTWTHVINDELWRQRKNTCVFSI